MKYRCIIGLGIALGLLMSAHALAQYLPNDRTINDNSLSGNFTPVVAGYSNSFDESLHQNGTSPTITIVDGAFLMPGIVGKSGSIINMSGGTLGGLSAAENATVNLSGGIVSSLNAGGGVGAGTPKANMTGGVATGVAAQSNGLLTITGGQISSSLQLFDSGVAKISNVTIGHTVNDELAVTLLDLHDQSHLELDGAMVGSADQSFRLFNTSSIKLNNTTAFNSINGLGQNTVEVTGGNLIGNVIGYNVKINDGTLAGVVIVQGAGAQGTISGTNAAGLTSGGTAGLATMSVTGSTITGDASALNGSALSASGTSFATNVSASGGPGGASTVILSGGAVGGKVSTNNGVVSATDVNISGDVIATASSVLGSITLNGGTVGGNVSATGNVSAIPNAIIQINGSNITGSVSANVRSAITLVSGSIGGNVAANTGPLTLMEVQGGTIAGNALSTARNAELRMSGGTVMGDVRATNRGTANVSGGTVNGNLTSDRATVNLSGGTVQGNLSVTNFGDGTMSNGSVLGNATLSGVSFTMTGGQVQGTFQVAQESAVSVTGGSITGAAAVQATATLNVSDTALFQDDLDAFDGGTLNFSGGSAKSVQITNQATLNMSGSAFVLGNLNLLNSSTANLNGGKASGALFAGDGSIITMTSGEVSGAFTSQQSNLTVQGGTIKGDLTAADASVIKLNGGSVSNNLFCAGQSTLVVEGTPLVAQSAEARDNSKLFIRGGGIAGHASAFQTAILSLSGSAFISGNLEGSDTAALSMSGGGVGGDLLVHDNSDLVLSGGNVAGTVAGLNNADITMTGGTVGGDAHVAENSKLILSGGNVAGILAAFNTADITMTGGTVGDIQMTQDQPGHGISIGGGHVTRNILVFNNAGLVFIAGTVGGEIQASQNSNVEIESIAAVAGSVHAFNSSTVTMHGGSIGVGPVQGDLTAQDSATLNLSAGTVGRNLTGTGSSIINMSGGTVFGFGVFQGNSKFNFSGGKILGGIIQPPGLSPSSGFALRGAANEVLNITATENATINIQGVDLVATLIDPNHQGASSLYQLSGLLADGTSISGGSMVIQNGAAAGFTLQIVPHWVHDGDGNWSNPANWVQGIPDAPGAVARFLDKITADRSIAVDGNFTVGQIVFNDTDRYTLTAAAGGSITLQGPAPGINVVGGTHHINAPLILTANTQIAVATSAALNLDGNLSIRAGAALLKTGPSTLRISGPQSHEANANLILSGGTLNLASDAGTPASIGAAALANLNLQISGGDTATILDASQDLANLTISHANAGHQSLDLHSPSTPGAVNVLRIYAADLSAAKGSLWEAIKNANIPGSPDPTDGIFDSGRPAHPATAVGLAQLPDLHGDPNIQIRLTRLGDLNLDGLVTISDFIDLASHFNSISATWQEGDLNYDGSVTISDFIDLASNFNTSYTGESSPISAADQQALSAFALAHTTTPVPEPVSTFSFLLIALPLCFRSHRKAFLSCQHSMRRTSLGTMNQL
jgi:hypothetical protein